MQKVNISLDSAGLAVGATSTKFSLNNSTDNIRFLIDNIFKVRNLSGSNTEDITFAATTGTSFYVLPDGYSCLLMSVINAAGTVTVIQGSPFKSEVVDGVTKYRGYREVKDAAGLPLRLEALSALHDYTSNFLPALPDDYAPLGAIKVATSGAAFTVGTTALDAGTVTDTYINFSDIPVATAI